MDAYRVLNVGDLPGYGVDPVRGFLPSEDPLEHLPTEYATWDDLFSSLPSLLKTGHIREAIDRIEVLDSDRLVGERQVQRAMLVLSMLGNAYVHGGSGPGTRIPRGLALPWHAVARRAERPMIVSHASVVLNNWRRIEANGPVKLGNIDTLGTFLGSADESWFFLVTVEIEAEGAAALPAIVRGQRAVLDQDDRSFVAELSQIEKALKQMRSSLLRMTERCDPAVFFHRIRPFLSGWPQTGVSYEGVDDSPRRLLGGSAAQSSLPQAIDAALGVEHIDRSSGTFLHAMRGYMPRRHRLFLEAVADGPSIRRFAIERAAISPHVQKVYNRCIDALCAFRMAHVTIVNRYITQQAPSSDEARGTGGTEYDTFLAAALHEANIAKLGE